ncbi:MAG TPA: hypothetical protein VLD19_19120 [Chitinophagaceae bacterium]|nr:hypothetical protein [Chitinophagaceae bacterium]
MTDNFEARKNLQAGTITAAILGLLLLLLLIVGWQIPSPAPPPVEEGLEVNLGNSDKGLGTDQAFEPGKPAPQDQQRYTPPKPVVAEKEEVKDPMTNDKDADVPEIKKPVIVKPAATKIAEKETVKKTPKKIMPKVEPTPAPAKPKAVFKGTNGTGTGGNEADSYKKGGNQGIAGGKGDQGQPGGDPSSTNYKGGGHGNSGVAISRGLEGRRIVRNPSFEDDFNENAKVAVDIRVDAGGNVISANFQQRGSTTSTASLIAIAKRKAMEVKFNTGGDESMGTIVFNFKLKN